MPTLKQLLDKERRAWTARCNAKGLAWEPDAIKHHAKVASELADAANLRRTTLRAGLAKAQAKADWHQAQLEAQQAALTQAKGKVAWHEAQLSSLEAREPDDGWDRDEEP